ncbi:extracellular matrix organizing protein FRAS1-like isoform X2 [Ischnura elegans]|uniref:extracellular matrix organizing protein FRAS1-like isoform X2 n=1 Tax=Ischnura elegans TaxID=197161 RepID=UPI001ED887EF|nr:extracellular matrix organizing protein FRAS1-like isoform X2 [Ischnura elegans]
MDTLPQLFFGCLILPAMVVSTEHTADGSSSVDILGAPLLLVGRGQPLNLTCLVKLSTTNEYDHPYWLHAGSVVSAALVEQHSGDDGSRRLSLVKKATEQSDEGVYACVVGGGEASITVRVIDEASAGGSSSQEEVLSPGGCVNAATGAILANGDEWREDPCTTCHCEQGRKKCVAHMCQTSCLSPRHVPGECCPVCDGTSVVTLPQHCPSLTHCSLKCPQGLFKDKDGCFQCLCQTAVSEGECPLVCEHGLARDATGHTLCQCAQSPCAPLLNCDKNCSHGLHANKHGCPVCKCHKCRRMVFDSASPPTQYDLGSLIKSSTHGVLLLCPGPCTHGHASDERGCPTCWCNEVSSEEEVESGGGVMTPVFAEEATKGALPCMSSDGTTKAADEVWWSGCRRCTCVHGVESCSKAACTPCNRSAGPLLIHCCPSSEPVSLIALSVLCALVLVVLVVIAVRIRHYVWWPRRGGGCLRLADEDGGVRVLGASPSPTDLQYELPLGGVGGTGTGKRRSGEYYESVPRYEPTLGDCEKSALAPL